MRIRHGIVGGVVAIIALGLCGGDTQGVAAEGRQDAVTYTKDVAPILFAHCVVCHRPDAIGPFSLMAYDDARQRADLIAAVTAQRAMPPWKPVPGYGRFQGERRLADAEIEVLGRWASTGAVEGERADLPATPVFADDWQLGEPDLVVTIDPVYTVPAGTTNIYRNFAVPVPLTERRWVRAVELRPGSAGVIHHARIMLDSTGRARQLDAADVEPGYDGLMLDHAMFPPGHVLSWTAGKRPTVVADSLAWPLETDTDLVLQLHLLTGAEPAAVQASVGLYFAESPPTLTPVAVLLNSKAIDIPAGEASHVVQDGYRLPVAVDLLAVYPHMHYLGKQVESVATLPDGSERRLLRIDDWDFDWQDEYRYVEPVHLPEGTMISARFVFDNSAGNPRNPHNPPEPVRFGPQATDEMAELMLQVLPIHPGDDDALGRNLALKRTRDAILGYQMTLRVNPTNHANHAGLAVRYLDIGQVALAKEHLEQALSLAPDFADAHFSLGVALLAEGDATAAIESYRRAIELKPDYADAHNNLGGLLASTGAVDDAIVYYRLALRFDPRHAGAHYNLANALLGNRVYDEAIMHYRDALAITPGGAAVHNNLARALLETGERGEAVTHYRSALAANPSLVPSLIGLAWLLATSPETELRGAAEAVTLAEQAVRIAGGEHPQVLDTLAAAYAADGRFDQAIQTARTAAAQARATPGLEGFVDQIEQRVQLYLAFTPYRTPQ